MLVQFRERATDDLLRTAGLDAIPQPFDEVNIHGTESMVAELSWNITPHDGRTDSIDVTIWLTT